MIPVDVRHALPSSRGHAAPVARRTMPTLALGIGSAVVMQWTSSIVCCCACWRTSLSRIVWRRVDRRRERLRRRPHGLLTFESISAMRDTLEASAVGLQ